jgi:hypothetical protein
VAAIGDGVSGTARVTVSPGTIRVRTIRYEVRSSRLRVTARMAETRGAPARAVSTTISVRRNGRQVFTGRKRTDVNGLVTYVLPAARGCYRTTVTGATSPGSRWNGTSPPNRFCSS